MFCTTAAENAVAEALGRLLVEDAFLFEHAKGISVEHFCPFVAVVTCGVATCHDVRELHGHTGS